MGNDSRDVEGWVDMARRILAATAPRSLDRDSVEAPVEDPQEVEVVEAGGAVHREAARRSHARLQHATAAALGDEGPPTQARFACGSSTHDPSSSVEGHRARFATQAATGQYGVVLLMSDQFVDGLSKPIQQGCRRLDCVAVKGSEEAITMFTFVPDMKES